MDKLTLVARARGKAKAASTSQNEDPLKSRQLYLDAAELFLEASKKSTGSESKGLISNAKHCYNQANALSPKKRTMVAGGADEDPEKEEKRKDEVIDSMRIEKPKLKFIDIGGLDDIKQSIRMMIIEPFKYPEVFEEFKKSAGGGILMYGPPGCGKTMLAEATAAEAEAAFYNVKVSTLKSKYVGETEKNISLLFKDARGHEPSIIFFDEIEALAEERSESDSSHGRSMVSQLLTEMDGLGTKGKQILLLGATNVPWLVDVALKRGGRFDRTLFIAPPDIEARKVIFKLHLEGRPIEDDIDFDEFAKVTGGFSGADIKTICETATDIPLQEFIKTKVKRKITNEDIFETIKKKGSSILPWFNLAIKWIKKEGKEDSYKEVLTYYDTVLKKQDDNISVMDK